MNLKDAIQNYLKRGFGSMNKNDFEVFIFNEWLSFEKNIGKSDYQISRELKIPESKVKRLRYEAALVYSGSQTDNSKLKEEFLKNLENAKYKADTYKLYFLVSNKLVRQYVNDLLEKDGRYLESSLTSSSVSIYIDDFIFLIESLNIVNKDIVIKKAKEESAKKKGFPIEWKDIIREFLIQCAKEKLGKLTANAIIESFEKLNTIVKKKNSK